MHFLCSVYFTRTRDTTLTIPACDNWVICLVEFGGICRSHLGGVVRYFGKWVTYLGEFPVWGDLPRDDHWVLPSHSLSSVH